MFSGAQPWPHTISCTRLCDLRHTRPDRFLRSPQLQKRSISDGEVFMPREKEFGVPGGMAGDLRTRLAGLGLALIALGPTLVVATGLVVTVLAVIDVTRPLVADVSAVAAIIESRISPRIAAVESAFARVGAPL